MKQYNFSVSMSYDECVDLYTGQYKHVVVRDDNGLSIQLPVHNLKPFITRIGIKGRFRMIINNQNKIQSIDRIA